MLPQLYQPRLCVFPAQKFPHVIRLCEFFCSKSEYKFLHEECVSFVSFAYFNFHKKMK
jgi:hypothetical protein